MHSYVPEHLVRRIVGRYLRDDRRYDRWGTLGKMMVVREILDEEQLAMSWDQIELVVNLVFPRTFIPPPKPSVSSELIPSVATYFEERLFEFRIHNLGWREAIGETAYHFNCTESGISRALRDF